ncbi:MAG: hypothetical protein AB7E55_02200 [Pigmentiphaga sp.]
MTILDVVFVKSFRLASGALRHLQARKARDGDYSLGRPALKTRLPLERVVTEAGRTSATPRT